jgi:hypothetical protein
MARPTTPAASKSKTFRLFFTRLQSEGLLVIVFACEASVGVVGLEGLSIFREAASLALRLRDDLLIYSS